MATHLAGIRGASGLGKPLCTRLLVGWSSTRIKNIEARVVCRAFCRRGDIPDSSSMPINYDAGVCSFAGLGGSQF